MAESHPAWVCGLKHGRRVGVKRCAVSHPAWVCGLKPAFLFLGDKLHVSHPAWVCGLKHRLMAETFLPNPVTPCVGVWIETFIIKPEGWEIPGHTLRGCVD